MELPRSFYLPAYSGVYFSLFMSVCTALIPSYSFEVSALENLQLYTSNVQSRASNPEEKSF